MPAARPLALLKLYWPGILLAVLPVLVHLPALSGAYRFDPLYIVSGLTHGTWRTNGVFWGYPGWIDGNAGVTTEALGTLAARDWLSGHVPWWNPYSGVGLPLAAEGQTPALFMPFVLLLAVPHGLLLLRLLLMIIAGLSTWALLRRLRLATMPAFTGAVLFELNGSFAWQAHGPMMPVAFLPLMLLGAEQACSGRLPLALVAGVAWSFLSGFPETAALNLLFVAAWCAMRLAQGPDRPRYAGLTLGATAAGLLIAAPAIWPFLQALPQEFVGPHVIGVRETLPRGSWALLLFPYLYGNIMQGPLQLHRLYEPWTNAGGYTDVLLVGLACLALRRRGPEVVLRWALAAWLTLTVLRAGGFSPAVFVFNLLPFIQQARIQVYIVPTWSMALSILAAFALQDWQNGRRLPLWSLLAVAGGAAGALIVALPDVNAMAPGLPAWVPWVAVIVPSAMFSAVVWLLRERRPRAGRVTLLVVANAAILAGLPLLAGTHGRALDDGSIRFLQQNAGLGRVVSFGPLVPNFGAMFGIAEISHNYLPVPRIWMKAVQERLLPDCDCINFHEGAPPPPERFGPEVPAYEDMGVHYALTWPNTSFPNGIAGITLAYRGDIMDVWALPRPKPYAEAAGCVITGGRTDLVADCAHPAMLVRRELFWAGWSVKVNGQEAALTQQDIFQGVALPAGRSVVTFRYAPPGINWCWLLAAFAIAGVTAVKLARFWRPQQDRASSYAANVP